ncbi:thiamine phosphate synthase [Thiohalorhabdus methylotrophus]|uniref:Thiamine-phosphate synthase n=1 Tax=Thiohalorhabdus methylotrophus TaxID=3242694 RepID=A0ABV4TUB6_9GAMM
MPGEAVSVTIDHRLSPIRGAYLIADRDHLPADRLLAATREALEGGARLVQYRDKGEDRGRRLQEARDLATLCREYDALFIVNDDPELARDAGANGVHLGGDDASIAEARRLLGDQVIIGASCYNDLGRAFNARKAGADYVAFGSFHPSPTKPDAVRAPLSLLKRARAELDLPIVVIGGVTPDNAAPLALAGADAAACISGILDAEDIREATRRLNNLLRLHW